ncbi:phBC6A51 family helix-turn-helix protein [Bacillus sp. JJ1503]|uniref:phBC6A51 family helix-turn-helix protein n=1 Tax=Bacillus sp. JJ1503 TaxID=3122956 RepID=UPI002FFE4D20
MALKRLNTEHLIAIKWLALPKKGGKTIAEIAQLCDVSEQSIYNWRKDPLFERELKREMVRNTLDKLPEVLEAVPDIIVRDGNAAMFKTLLQAHDMLTDKVEVETKQSGDSVNVDELRARLERLRADDSKAE